MFLRDTAVRGAKVALHFSDPARLRRSSAAAPSLVDHAASEWIGEGPLGKMVRVALSDPDEEIWRYALSVAGTVIEGDAIETLASLIPAGAAGKSPSPEARR